MLTDAVAINGGNMLQVLKVTIIISILAGCRSSEPPEPTETTPACYKYQLMMTAPMPEEAMQRLERECKDSH